MKHEAKEGLMIQCLKHHPFNHGGGNVMACVCMGVNGTGPLVFINDVATGRNSRMISKVYGAIPFGQKWYEKVKL